MWHFSWTNWHWNSLPFKNPAVSVTVIPTTFHAHILLPVKERWKFQNVFMNLGFVGENVVE
jgi:hypothetical protein